MVGNLVSEILRGWSGICKCVLSSKTFTIQLSGYLLDPNGEKCVTAPRQVSALHHKDVSIAMVAASDGATVVVTEKGDFYLLAEYQCKKLASRYRHYTRSTQFVLYIVLTR